MSDPNVDKSKLAPTSGAHGRSVMGIIFYVMGSLGFTMVGLVTFVFFTCKGCI